MSDFEAYKERLKDAAKLDDVVAATTGWTLVRRGKYFGVKEHDSLSIDPERGWFEWYSKGSGPGSRGDVFEWLVHHGGQPDFMSAVRWLADRTGIHFQWSEKETAAFQARRAQRAALTVVAEFLAGLLLRGMEPDASATLADGWRYALGRGWDVDTIRRARLGYWDWGLADGLRKHLQMHEVELARPEVVAVLGYQGDVQAWGQKWGIKVQAEWIKNGRVPGMPPKLLVYPHFEGNECVYLAGRRIDWKPDDEWGKSWNVRSAFVGGRKPYWNWEAFRQRERIVVVEGQADAVTLAGWGIPAVALAGSSANDELIGLLRKRERVYVALDSDAAGDKATYGLAEKLGAATPVVTWPEGKDANGMLQSGEWDAEKAEVFLASKSEIFALWVARQWKSAPAAEVERARRYAFEIIAQLLPYDYAQYAPLLAGAMRLVTESGAPKLSELGKMVRAVRLERDLAASGVPDAKPVMDVPKPAPVQEKEGGRFPELTAELAEKLMAASRDHEGHARCVAAVYGKRLAFVPGTWGWMYYEGTHWERTGAEHQAQRLVVRTLKMRRHLGVEHEVEALVKSTVASKSNVTGTQSLLEKLVLADTDDFDTMPDLLNVVNGVLNLRTGELLPHDARKYKFTYCIPYAYDPTADYTEWLSFLGTVTGVQDKNGIYHVDREMLDWLQMAVGYSLTGHTTEACVFYIYGPTRSGKGTFTQTLQRLLGKPLAAGIDFQVLVANREADAQNFALAPLKPCRMVVGSEPGKYERFNEAKLKLLTGEDVVRCSFKRQDHFEFVPQFKIWLSSNWPFNADTADDAAWGRARVIEFPNSFLGNEDKHLKARLQSDEGMAGVLAWAVEGAKRWYAERDGLRTPPAVVRAGKEQREAQDYIQQFLDECVVAGDAQAEFVEARALYAAYKKWCEGELTPQKSRSFSLSIQAKGFEYGRSYVNVRQLYMDEDGQMQGRKQVRGYHGLRLNAVGQDLLLSAAIR